MNLRNKLKEILDKETWAYTEVPHKLEALIEQTVLDVIGVNDPPSVWSKVDGAIRNKLRAEQRKRLKDLLSPEETAE